jgi:hypothetical protein
MGRYGDEVAALAAPLTDSGDLDVSWIASGMPGW